MVQRRRAPVLACSNAPRLSATRAEEILPRHRSGAGGGGLPRPTEASRCAGPSPAEVRLCLGAQRGFQARRPKPRMERCSGRRRSRATAASGRSRLGRNRDLAGVERCLDAQEISACQGKARPSPVGHQPSQGVNLGPSASWETSVHWDAARWCTRPRTEAAVGDLG